MLEAPSYSNFVSLRVDLGFADAAEAAESLPGTTFTAAKHALTVKELALHTVDGQLSYSGVLHAAPGFLPGLPVEVVVSAWSAGRSEIGIRPLSRLGAPSSLRSLRFFRAAWAVLPEIIAELLATRSATTEAPGRLPAAA